MPPHPQFVWQVTLRALCGSQTLAALWRHLQDFGKANDRSLVPYSGISGKLDLEMGQVDENIDGKKDGERIVDEQTVRHLLDS